MSLETFYFQRKDMQLKHITLGTNHDWIEKFLIIYLLPPLFFLGTSMGTGNALTCFTGGGSWSLSNFCSISPLSWSPTLPSTLSWKASTRAANVHFAETNLAAFFLRSLKVKIDCINHIQKDIGNCIVYCFIVNIIFYLK